MKIARNNRGTLSLGTIGLGVFLVVVVGSVTLVLLSASDGVKSESESTLIVNKPMSAAGTQNSNPPFAKAVPKEIPAEVKSYVGTIVSVHESSITIQAEAETNYLTQDTRLTAEFTPSTLITRLSLPKTITVDQDISQFMKRETIVAADLAVGDLVTVVAEENAKGKETFKVQSIEVRVVK